MRSTSVSRAAARPKGRPKGLAFGETCWTWGSSPSTSSSSYFNNQDQEKKSNIASSATWAVRATMLHSQVAQLSDADLHRLGTLSFNEQFTTLGRPGPKEMDAQKARRPRRRKSGTEPGCARRGGGQLEP
eukprot:g29367.t1